jgi:hypothetical protein
MTGVAVPGGAGNKQGFETAYRELVDSDRFQTDLPRYDPPEIEPRESPLWLQNLLEWLSGTGSFWQALFWITAIAFAALILFVIGRTVYRAYLERRGGQTEASEEEDWRPDVDTARGLLGDADALAKQGRFAEAVHILLFRSLDQIEQHIPDFLQPALTSRDIAGSPTLPGPARSAFSTIARIVERGLFAARPVDETGWQEARTAYERFAFGESWS